MNNTQKRRCKNIKYLVLPEKHEDGAWHFHGLLSDIDELSMTYFKNGIYNLDTYNWGFTTASKIKDTRKASSYITKYISKQDLDLPGRKRYYVSANLDKPKVELLHVESIREIEELVNRNKKEICYTKTASNDYMDVSYLELTSNFIIADSDYTRQFKNHGLWGRKKSKKWDMFYSCPVLIS